MNEPTPASQNTTLMTGVAIFAVIALFSVGAVALQRQSQVETQPEMTATSPAPAVVTSSPVASPTSTTNPVSTVGEYKDGTYTAEGNYTSPGGPEEVGVKLTLADNVITDVEFEQKATLPISQKMQAEFAANYKPLVMGKNINDIKLDKVGGSSLTPKGFNDAIEKIKTQAQS